MINDQLLILKKEAGIFKLPLFYLHFLWCKPHILLHIYVFLNDDFF